MLSLKISLLVVGYLLSKQYNRIGDLIPHPSLPKEVLPDALELQLSAELEALPRFPPAQVGRSRGAAVEILGETQWSDTVREVDLLLVPPPLERLKRPA